ncbi:tripartite tricarboxylate transporter permease [Salsuginibacillus kocurii]|uniref:tripartite tricarboxylate transporter permease n=1 Tax=Salsuginibacillus kocurii TaxID=427078 RepID=UPI00037BB2F9|nr:tripartite tricarboxylate transporter permease [Salsuginibacillus kocurii]
MSVLDGAALMEGLNLIMSPTVLLFIILGIIVGIFLGSLPGISGVMGIAIMLPVTYQMEAIHALMFLTGIFTGSVYASGVTAILLNIPGGPGAVATTFDGYKLTQKGRQNEALGIGIGSSVLGGVISYVLVLFFIQPLGQLVLSFGAPEMLMLTLFALSVIGAVQGSIIKVFIAGTLGLMLGTIGATAFGSPRGTFGQASLYEGIEIIPALMGLLALSELFFLISRKFIVDDGAEVQKNFKDLLRGVAQPFKEKVNSIRSSLIGMFVGLLPAAGGTVAAILSYGQAQMYSRKKENFGHGEPSGVVAAEAANSSSEGGSMTTMMTFGIPGGSATAVLMAGFMIHGLIPGPYLIRDDMDLAYAVILGNIGQMFILLVLGIIFVWYFSKIVMIPTRLLIPIIGVLAILGALSIRGLYIDVILTLIFAFIGFVMRKLDYPIIAILLGIILGSIVDTELSRTIIMYENNPMQLFERPVFVIMLVLTIIMFLFPTLQKLYGKSREKSSS